jgi:hypothetical protein
VEETGIPQPFPLPKPNTQLLRSSGVTDPGVTTPVQVAGLPGVVPKAGKITIENQGKTVEVQATESGSFFATVDAKAKDVLDVRYETSEPAQIEVPLLGIQTPKPPGPAPGVPPLEGPTGGVVTVRGLGNTGVDIFVVNLGSGEIGTGQTAGTDGAFELKVKAQKGDTLRVYEDLKTLLGFWELKVP